MIVALLGWIGAALAVEVPEAIPQREAVTVSMVVSVADRGSAADAIVADAEARGGWFALRTPDQLVTRVPVGQVDAHLEVVLAQGRALDRVLQRRDLSREIAEVDSRIDAREAVLARYEEALDRAEPGSVVAVEHRLGAEISALEQLEGQRRVLEDTAAYARVDVAFQFRDRTAPAANRSSPFAWVDGLRIQDLHQAALVSRAGWQTRGVGVEAPSGFGTWRDPRRFRATSPDGVTYRVRTVRHRPRAELAFWQEAVREHLSGAGYAVVSEGEVSVDGRSGALIELAAPLDVEDWGWIVAVVPSGRRLVIAEAAGEIQRLEAHKAAILDSISALDVD